MAFGFLGKMASGMGKGMKSAGKAMTGRGGGVNAAPSGNFMSRFKQAAPTALNNAAQMWGGQMAPMARMTAGMRRPGNSANTPAAENAQNPPMMPEGINVGPSPNFMPNMGGFGGAFLPPGIADKMGGNTGFTGGMWNRPRLDPTTNQYNMPAQDSGSIFSRIYGGMQPGFRPQIYT